MLGMDEMLIIGIAVLLLLFGAKKIPELAKNLGRATGEFQRGKMEVEKEIREAKLLDKTQAAESQFIKVAKDLGIDATGKSDEQLREEIIKQMSTAS